MKNESVNPFYVKRNEFFLKFDFLSNDNDIFLIMYTNNHENAMLKFEIYVLSFNFCVAKILLYPFQYAHSSIILLEKKALLIK